LCSCKCVKSCHLEVGELLCSSIGGVSIFNSVFHMWLGSDLDFFVWVTRQMATTKSNQAWVDSHGCFFLYTDCLLFFFVKKFETQEIKLMSKMHQEEKKTDLKKS
jgi:hypothetical protein